MLNILNPLKGKSLWIMGGAILLFAGSTYAMTRAYLAKRDDLAAQVVLTQEQKARADAHLSALKKAELRRQQVEAARETLLVEVESLKAAEVQTITEIREVWRDREVIIESPVAVECAAKPLPTAVLRLLCKSGGGGACATL